MVRHALVTGARGFIGSHLTHRLLEDGWTVTALVRPQTTLTRPPGIAGDLIVVHHDLTADPDRLFSLVRPPVDVCFHLAWQQGTRSYFDATENITSVLATMQLLRFLEVVGCERLIGTGTCLEYASSPSPFIETSPRRADRLYPVAKDACARIIEQFFSSREGTAVWTRIFHVYGPGDVPGRIVPHIISHLMRDQPCQLTSGLQVRDFIYIADVVEALIELAGTTIEGAVNIGSGIGTRVRDLALELAGLLDRSHLLEFGSQPLPEHELPTIVADIRRLTEETKWRARYSLRAGLAATVADYTRQYREELSR